MNKRELVYEAWRAIQHSNWDRARECFVALDKLERTWIFDIDVDTELREGDARTYASYLDIWMYRVLVVESGRPTGTGREIGTPAEIERIVAEWQAKHPLWSRKEIIAQVASTVYFCSARTLYRRLKPS